MEMLNVAKAKYPDWEELTSAMNAANFNTILGISYLVSPIYGTSMS